MDTQLSNIHLFKNWFSNDHIVFTATHEELGLRLLDQYNFDYIVSDHHLFGILGREFLKFARIKQPLLKTILLETLFESTMTTPGLDRSIVDHLIQKPYHPIQLEQFFIHRQGPQNMEFNYISDLRSTT